MTEKTRSFKTAWFAKAARKAHITDAELCEAIAQVQAGQADNLGGGVFKKRLKQNTQRAIILARVGRWWVFEYLFAKKDRANIDVDELTQFRALATSYARLSDSQLALLITSQHFVEICHAQQA